MIELRHLKTLMALRDTGSLVEAADRLFLTQSALSHQLKDLEDRLSCRLFIRKTKPPRFTSAGRRLLALADEIIPMCKLAERDIGRLAEGEAGRLHICIECHSCYQWLLPCIDKYRSNWPEVELDLTGGFNFAPLPALVRGDLDLVITSDPITLPGIRYVPLFRYEAMLAIDPHHALVGRPWINAEDLSNQVMITYPVERDRLTPMMVQLVASGRGVACLPNWSLAEYLDSETIVAKKLGEQGLWSTLYAAIRDDQFDSPFMQDFLVTANETCFENLKGIRSVQGGDSALKI
jgi:LysR family transcriptional regulator for metE and metH